VLFTVSTAVIDEAPVTFKEVGEIVQVKLS
jgi:hypothetical protein